MPSPPSLIRLHQPPTTIRHPDDIARLRAILNAAGYDADDSAIQWAWSSYSQATWAAGWAGLDCASDLSLLAAMVCRLKPEKPPTTRVTLFMNDSDIAEGWRRHRTLCPIARAAKRCLPTGIKLFDVGYDGISAWLPDGRCGVAWFDESVVKWQRDFDKRRDVSPVRIEMEFEEVV